MLRCSASKHWSQSAMTTNGAGDKKVIVLEFNELVPSLVDRFIAEGKLPNFKRLRNESTVAVTDA